MRYRWVVSTALAIPLIAQVSFARPAKKQVDPEPPALKVICSNTERSRSSRLHEIVDVNPEVPLGPKDLLKGYEVALTLIAQDVATEIQAIVQAYETSQITHEQAEFLIQQKYQVGMMQFQVISALHEILDSDVRRDSAVAKSSEVKPESGTVLVVPPPTVSCQGENCSPQETVQ